MVYLCLVIIFYAIWVKNAKDIYSTNIHNNIENIQKNIYVFVFTLWKKQILNFLGSKYFVNRSKFYHPWDWNIFQPYFYVFTTLISSIFVFASSFHFFLLMLYYLCFIYCLETIIIVYFYTWNGTKTNFCKCNFLNCFFCLYLYVWSVLQCCILFVMICHYLYFLCNVLIFFLFPFWVY